MVYFIKILLLSAEHGVKKLAEKIGTRVNNLSDMEPGQLTISRMKAKKFAAIFNVSPRVYLKKTRPYLPKPVLKFRNPRLTKFHGVGKYFWKSPTGTG
jgi:hypothetical protein